MIWVIAKTIFLYFFIVFLYRIMGKKEVGQLDIIDLIVWILIAELAAVSLERPDETVWSSVIPITTLFMIQITLSYLTLKNSRFRRFIDGSPTVIIKNGKLMFQEMYRLRYSLDDLISQLREQGIRSIEDVNFAILENNGKLSVFSSGGEYPLPLILDGVIDQYVLKEIRKDEAWLMRLLKKRGIELHDVFYAFYTKNRTFIIRKSELES